MSIKFRIWALPIISSVVLALGLGISMFFTINALSSIKNTGNVDYPVLSKAKSINLNINNLIDAFKDAVGEDDKKKLDVIVEQSNKIKKELKELSEVSNDKDFAKKLEKEFDSYYTQTMSVTKKMMGVEEGDIQALIPEMQKSLKSLQDDLVKLNDNAQSQFKTGIDSSETLVNRLLYANVLVSVLVSLILFVTSYIIIKIIWKQLGGEPEYARKSAQAIASGDLSKEIKIDTNDTTSLLAAMNEMQIRLGSMINGIKQSSYTIKESSDEMSNGNMDLSARTENQASSLEETASAMEELTATVKQNAENANTANNLVINSSHIAIKGGEVVNDVISTMNAIKASSNKITEIISVIDGIAFQTNILALNAAVEAARAGEQGRGFAVVAAEVRSLAQKSATAAKEIKTLIADSGEKVDNGNRLVNVAGKTMTEIVDSVKQVADLMAGITLASQEQSTGLNEVNQSISSMDKMTQQNAALVEEAAASAKILQDQAQILLESVSVFKIGEGQ